MALVIQKIGIFMIDWRDLYSGLQKDEFHRKKWDEVNLVARDDDLEFKKLIIPTEPDRARKAQNTLLFCNSLLSRHLCITFRKDASVYCQKYGTRTKLSKDKALILCEDLTLVFLQKSPNYKMILRLSTKRRPS